MQKKKLYGKKSEVQLLRTELYIYSYHHANRSDYRTCSNFQGVVCTRVPMYVCVCVRADVFSLVVSPCAREPSGSLIKCLVILRT